MTIDRVLRIGTAGWSVPAQYAANVPDAGSHLERYAHCLNAVEINSSFYRPHLTKTYERWSRSTPEDFRFSVKLPKTMSHERQLQDCGALLDRFASEVAGLGEKLGVVLVQLPPKSVLRKRVADGFFRALHKRIKASIALEPRHASWFAPGVSAWLAERKIARVAADPARVNGAGIPGGWKGLVYYRWHGAPRIYFSNYEEAELAALKRRLDKIDKRTERWCIFDNTGAGAAFGNARSMNAPASGDVTRRAGAGSASPSARRGRSPRPG
jgi:uncharacterized protein YecE (DUF72 family)